MIRRQKIAQRLKWVAPVERDAFDLVAVAKRQLLAVYRQRARGMDADERIARQLLAAFD
jgi:hypothetical protein